MIRQSLEPNSAYADVALHGDGLTALQYRPAMGVETSEFRAAMKSPLHLSITRLRNEFTIQAGNPGEEPAITGPIVVTMQDPVYLGLAVCAHNADVLETAVFSNIQMKKGFGSMSKLFGIAALMSGALLLAQAPTVKKSHIVVYSLSDKSVKTLYSADRLIEAPNWSPDGKSLLVNTGGELYRLPVGTAKPELEKVDLGAFAKCNNDKGFSPDGKTIAFSSSAKGPGSQVFTVSAAGGTPKMIVQETPSYFHGFSPDGKWLAVVAQREKNFDLYRVPADGGAQERLTSSPGYDDGPDYSPDGKWIYFNSDRAGGWDIWAHACQWRRSGRCQGAASNQR